MSTMIITTRVNHHYLMNKTKWDLASWIMDDFDRIDELEEEVAKLKAEIEKMENAVHRVDANATIDVWGWFCSEMEKES